MDNFIQLTISGLSLGSLFALVAIGFAILLKATGHFNLLPGALVMLGAYLTYQFHVLWAWPFFVSVFVSVIVCSVLGLFTDRLLFNRLGSKGHSAIEHLAVLLVSMGILSIVQALVVSVWTSNTFLINDPWGLSVIRWGSISVAQRDIWSLGLAMVLLTVFFFVIQKTNVGVGMRALAEDAEAARAQGINPRTVGIAAWLMCGAASVLAGVMLATEIGGGLVPTLDQIAFTALPALIIGGIGSLPGCIYGGLALGLVQTFAAGYAGSSFGQGFATAVPWAVLILLLVLRPSGLAKSLESRKA